MRSPRIWDSRMPPTSRVRLRKLWVALLPFIVKGDGDIEFVWISSISHKNKIYLYNRYLNEHKVSSYYDRPNTVHPLDSLYGSWIHFDTSIGWQIHTSQGKTDTTIIHTPSLIAGLLGLAFGPNGLGWIPLSNDLGTYAAILIALVFGALPLSSPNVSMKEVAKRVGPMWAYAQVGMLLQWALVGLFGLYVIKLIWPDLNDAFGIMLPTGFYGGHGTAAAIGSAFEGLGWDEARSLGMTTATVGVICSIIGGLLMVKWAAKHKQTAFISDFDDLPDELRSGLLPEDKRDSIGEATTSSISIDTLTFHVALVFVVAFWDIWLAKP